MKQSDWDLIYNVHVKGAYKCARAAWPYFRKQKYGRLISTASAAGLFGSFGQTNYSGKPTKSYTSYEYVLIKLLQLPNSPSLASPKPSRRRVSSTTFSATSLLQSPPVG